MINHTAKARGAARIKKTMGIQIISITFHQPHSLMPRSVRPAASLWQAAMLPTLLSARFTRQQWQFKRDSVN